MSRRYRHTDSAQWNRYKSHILHLSQEKRMSFDAIAKNLENLGFFTSKHTVRRRIIAWTSSSSTQATSNDIDEFLQPASYIPEGSPTPFEQQNSVVNDIYHVENGTAGDLFTSLGEEIEFEPLLSMPSEDVFMTGELTQLHHSPANQLLQTSKRRDFKSKSRVVSVSTRSPLSLAAHRGHYGAVVRLLEHKDCNNVDIEDDEGITPLWLAAQSGHIKLVLLFLEKSANPNATDITTGRRPLHQAAYNGHGEVVRQLIKHTEEVDVPDQDGLTPLWLAAQAGDVTAVTELLGESPRLDAVDKQSGRQPLHQAAQNGHSEVVRLLLDAGAEADATDYDGVTPLWLAVAKGSIGAVDNLLKARANPNILDSETSTRPIHQAASNGHTEIFRMLLEHVENVDAPGPNNITALWLAAQSGDATIVSLLLEKNAKIDACDSKSGRQPLHCAAHWGHIEAVQLLLEAKANPDAQTYSGATPLYYASLKGHATIVKKLLQEGANADVEISESGRRPLHEAAKEGHHQVVRLLLEKTADFDIADHQGLAPLALAAEKGDAVSVAMLLAKGANANLAASGGFKRLPLHHAAQNGHGTVVQTLLNHTQNVDAEDSTGITPLFLAAAAGDISSFTSLLAKGARVSSKNLQDGRQPIHEAAYHGNAAIMAILLPKIETCDVTDYERQTPVFLAAINGHLSCVSMLLEAGAAVGIYEDEDGLGLLHYATLHGYSGIVEMVLNYTDVIDPQSREGVTPLLLAAEEGDLEIVNLLLGKGANANATNRKDGRQAIHQASEQGYTNIVHRLLEENTVDVNVEAFNGMRPLTFAVHEGHFHTIKALIQKGARKDILHKGSTLLDLAACHGNQEVVKLLTDDHAQVEEEGDDDDESMIRDEDRDEHD